MPEQEVEKALKNPAIIRNRLKVRAAVKNARAFLDLQENAGSFDAFIWSFTGARTIHNAWKTMDKIPSAIKKRKCLLFTGKN